MRWPSFPQAFCLLCTSRLEARIPNELDLVLEQNQKNANKKDIHRQRRHHRIVDSLITISGLGKQNNLTLHIISTAAIDTLLT